MKELTIEEKARAYDEAIERARKLHENSNGTILKKWLWNIFPELKESEDERIVKELLTFFRESIHGGHILTNKEYDSWIAWLEKQGKKNPANWLQELEDKLANATPKQLAEWKEKYFKEEPAEWSEEDEKAINDIMWIIETYRKNGFNEIHIQIADSSENWLKSIKYRSQWKPSDEQMKALSDINLTGDISYVGQGQELINLYNELKKLKG